jgi:hypothetical protein
MPSTVVETLLCLLGLVLLIGGWILAIMLACAMGHALAEIQATVERSREEHAYDRLLLERHALELVALRQVLTRQQPLPHEEQD